MKFSRHQNRITSPPTVLFEDIGEIAAALHGAIDQMKYSDVVLNFSKCQLAEPEFMLAVCSLCSKYKANNIGIDLILPSDEKLRRLFVNTNWAHHISPSKYPLRQFNGYSQVPATHFSNAAEQYSAVSKIVDVILSNIDARVQT